MTTPQMFDAARYPVGPIQVILIGFDRVDQFHGEIRDELANLRGRGLIRLIDVFLAVKDSSGMVTKVELQDLSEDESVEFGRVVGRLLGDAEMSGDKAAAEVVEKTLSAAFSSYGLDYPGLRQMVENLPAGKAFGILMVEHVWAIPLRNAIRQAGGKPIAQGFLTLEALTKVGQELQAIVEAERTIEVASAVQAAAILDTLATLEEAEAIKTAIAADVVRTLAAAELIEEAAIAEVIDTLEATGLLEQKYLEEAREAEAEEATEDKEFFAGTA
jgi:uncharacterized membrane protein